jgi:hypothetical protein
MVGNFLPTVGGVEVSPCPIRSPYVVGLALDETKVTPRQVPDAGRLAPANLNFLGLGGVMSYRAARLIVPHDRRNEK